MARYSFPKSERLVKRPEFDKVMREGKKRRVDTVCTVFYLPNGLNRKRLGIIASKKVGNAVQRNRAKRKIREVFRCMKDRISPAMDIVVISGKDLVPLHFGSLAQKISKTLLTIR